MIETLSPAQRLLGLFAIVFLVSALVLTVSVWPRRNEAVVADLNSPECQSWRDISEDRIPRLEPSPTEPCYALRYFLFHERATIRSEAEYGRHRFTAGIMNGLTFLAIWAAFVGGVYLLGLAGNATRRFMTKLTSRQP
ncbi:MAG: hypothetical protein L6Q83_06300 [Gammaproteobacteria bacterium]|jgi:hypothetical protein|nr:hypothetical protein [Gammaproteobacteria bacterium]